VTKGRSNAEVWRSRAGGSYSLACGYPLRLPADRPSDVAERMTRSDLGRHGLPEFRTHYAYAANDAERMSEATRLDTELSHVRTVRPE
jgi:hypothetical protein